MPLVQDQINDLAGVDSPIEVKVFGPDFGKLRELAEQVGEIVEKVDGVADMNAHVYLGNPDVVIRPDSLQTARVGLTELDHNVGIAEVDVCVHVHHAVHLLDDLATCRPGAPRSYEVGAEDLHLDRAVDAGQVVELGSCTSGTNWASSSGTSALSSSRRTSKSLLPAAARG